MNCKIAGFVGVILVVAGFGAFGCLPTSIRKDSWVDDYNRLIGGISAEIDSILGH